LCLAALLVVARPAPAPGQASGPLLPVRVLHFNLCNSGFASCYTGRAVDTAAGVVRDHRPDVVTLNEICAGDVERIAAVVAALHPAADVVRAFEPAGDRRTGAPFLCVDGEAYGIGLVVRVPAGHRPAERTGGLYDDAEQDVHDPERRAWVCLRVPAAVTACTTHLANTSPPVALAQCRRLFAAAPAPAVVAADFNLGVGGTTDVRSCLPAGSSRQDDGAVQHVVAGAGYAVVAANTVDMGQSTDHAALLVTLATR
jgi:hypothetical protein